MICRTCGQDKPLTEFYKRCSRSNRYRTDCKKCHNDKIMYRYRNCPETRESYKRRSQRYYLKKLYGLTLEDYDRLLEEQDHRCAICREPESQDRALAVDHCHDTGKVRSLLCQACNTGIGKLKEDPELLRKAALYLESHTGETIA